jgi:hypothetical protein
MKIVITEVQLNKLLVEIDKSSEVNAQSVYNQLVSITSSLLPLASKIVNVINTIKNNEEFMTLLSLFKDMKTGYSSFEEMINNEFSRFSFDQALKLDEKFTSIGVNCSFNTFTNRLGKRMFNGGFKIYYNKLNEKSQLANSSCELKYQPLLIQAKNYWIQWLSSPVTKEKFIKNWNIDPKTKIVKGLITVDTLFNTYIRSLNRLKLIFYDETMKIAPIFTDIDMSTTFRSYAFVNSSITPEHIFINCSLVDPDPLGTLIHEIQHLIYAIKPLSPSQKIGDVFVNKNTKKITPKNLLGFSISVNTNNSSKTNNLNIDFKKLSNKLGVDFSYLKLLYSWAISYEKQIPEYSCKETEKMSNIMSIRHLLNVQPGQDITFEMIKPYINGKKHHTDINWILYCWALKGFPDINQLLNKINQLTYQQSNQNNNTV